MKEFRFRIILILGAIALSVYLLWPTYQDYQHSQRLEKIGERVADSLKTADPDMSEERVSEIVESKIDSVLSADQSIREARSKRVKLGLDLQGGMRVVLEVDTGELLRKLAKEPDEKFNRLLDEAIKEDRQTDEGVVSILVRKLRESGTRLSRYFGNIRDDEDDIVANLEQQTEDAVTRAREIITNRVDQYGVAEPTIQRQGSRRIIVELPGVANEEEARQLIQSTALLEFKIVREPEFTFNVMTKIDNVLAGKPAVDTTAADTTAAIADAEQAETEEVAETDADSLFDVAEGDEPASEPTDVPEEDMTAEEWAEEHPFFSVAMVNPESGVADAYVRESERSRLWRMLDRPDVQRVIPNNVEFVLSSDPSFFDEGEAIYTLYLVNKTAELTGGVITEATANLDPTTSAAVVNMEMNSEGATEWARITGANVEKRCAIILDGVVYSAPVIRNKITGGRSQIDGMENLQEARNLAIILNAGAFSAPVEIIEERTVGPSLGQDSISSGFSSALLGFGIVAVFMIFYYQKAGSFAALSLTFTVMFILGVLAGFNATLTLPGIAGIVLTIGMAVDANVLIFERIREEYGAGKTMKASVEGGFKKAYSAIWDSNITTFFTGVILYQFGTGPVQGFALTLMIGIASSLFSALVISKLIFDYMNHKGYKISIG
jgi:preprotein translocase subunit SecD